MVAFSTHLFTPCLHQTPHYHHHYCSSEAHCRHLCTDTLPPTGRNTLSVHMHTLACRNP